MANQTNPYADMMNAWTQNFKTPQLSMPNFDMTQVVTFGRRNAEAVTAAGQCMAESAQSITRRQAELARAQVEKLLKTTKDMLVNGSPEINTTKQVELAKTMFESSLNNLREVGELVTKSSFEMFDVLNKRASESIEEVTAHATSTTPKKKAA
ncbi:MAG: phasin family protein [Rickettsiales bacterium]